MKRKIIYFGEDFFIATDSIAAVYRSEKKCSPALEIYLKGCETAHLMTFKNKELRDSHFETIKKAIEEE